MRRAGGGDDGSSVVEFTLVSVLLVGLFLGILQVALVLHTRNVLVSAAQEGARYAANADRPRLTARCAPGPPSARPWAPGSATG